MATIRERNRRYLNNISTVVSGFKARLNVKDPKNPYCRGHDYTGCPFGVKLTSSTSYIQLRKATVGLIYHNTCVLCGRIRDSWYEFSLLAKFDTEGNRLCGHDKSCLSPAVYGLKCCTYHHGTLSVLCQILRANYNQPSIQRTIIISVAA